MPKKKKEKTTAIALGVICAFLITLIWFLGNALIRADEKVKAQGYFISRQREYIDTCLKLVSVQDEIIALQKN